MEPDPRQNLRELADRLLSECDAWRNAPGEKDSKFFRTWQLVSLALQRALREWVVTEYFRDPRRFDDVEAALPVLVYKVTRLSYGRPRVEFAYDALDPTNLVAACRQIESALEKELARVQKIVDGQPMAPRYLPGRAHDIVFSAIRKRKRLHTLLANEAAVVNEVIQLGVSHDSARFSRSTNAILHRFYGRIDWRPLGPLILDEATRSLQQQNSMILTVRHEDPPAPVRKNAVRARKLLGDRRDHVGTPVNTADRVVLGVRDVN
jgi:hypothetical protein